jgi:hypothetical protein
MTQKHDDRPEFIIAQRSRRTRHSRRANAIVQNPLELAIRIALHVLRRQGRDGRRYVINEGDAGVLAIHTVASNTIMGERFLTVIPGIFVIRQRILLALVADQDVTFGKYYRLRLQLSWWVGLTMATTALTQGRMSSPPRGESMSSRHGLIRRTPNSGRRNHPSGSA